MNGRVLVAYASRYGSTAGVAQAVGDALRRAGVATDVAPVGEAGDLAGYDAVVFGAPIFAGQLVPAMPKYLASVGEALADKPVACFLVGLSLVTPKEEDLAKARAALEPITSIAEPLDVGYFGGSSKQLPLPLRPITRAMGSAPGDHRDWAAIGAWSESLAERLQAL